MQRLRLERETRESVRVSVYPVKRKFRITVEFKLYEDQMVQWEICKKAMVLTEVVRRSKGLRQKVESVIVLDR